MHTLIGKHINQDKSDININKDKIKHTKCHASNYLKILFECGFGFGLGIRCDFSLAVYPLGIRQRRHYTKRHFKPTGDQPFIHKKKIKRNSNFFFSSDVLTLSSLMYQLPHFELEGKQFTLNNYSLNFRTHGEFSL